MAETLEDICFARVATLVKAKRISLKQLAEHLSADVLEKISVVIPPHQQLSHFKWCIRWVNGTKREHSFYNSSLKLHGLSRKWDICGRLSEESEWKNGLKDGRTIYYEPSKGTIQSQETYSRGQKHGNCTTFVDGKIQRVQNFYRGLKDGEILSYYPDGTLRKKQEYHRGEKNGIFEWYNETGSIVRIKLWAQGIGIKA